MRLVAPIVGGLFMLVLVIGALMHLDARSDLGQLGKLQVVDIDKLDRSDKSAVVEGTVALHDPPVRGPLSGDKVAWWTLTKTRFWKERREDCDTDSDGDRTCTTEIESYDEQMSFDTASNNVDVRGRELVVSVDMQSDEGGQVKRLHETGTDTRSDTERDDNEIDAHIDTVERALLAGDTVTVIGNIKWAGDEPTMTKRTGLPVIYRGTYAQYTDELEVTRRTGIILLAVGGIGTLLFGALTVFAWVRNPRLPSPSDFIPDELEDQAILANVEAGSLPPSALDRLKTRAAIAQTQAGPVTPETDLDGEFIGDSYPEEDPEEPTKDEVDALSEGLARLQGDDQK